ncbi:hypothetical protein UA08_02404 [Talaromyces atroroseus]|uniref:Major facilitator superfamily (MFS) profile domain-containing protein n=1 Tax=Talaromyces atroroseus TaxID=1441469 RepID=A0A225AXI8_TALAT|nr:hypothetical protein UA08_02404 [Talaromyces atroroseus]OKL62048.1 hypothetical protein UA08_02404 [Talaromyces atroroseus]
MFYKEGIIPKSSSVLVALIVMCSSVTSTTMGYDGSLMNGLNMLPAYNDYFQMDTSKTSLSTASTWIGNIVIALVFAKVPDAIGRKPKLWNVRGFEDYRWVWSWVFFYGWSDLFLGDFAYEMARYVGGLVASGVTYATNGMSSSWAWRMPNLLQGFFSIVLLLFLPFIPESPRWLASARRRDESRRVLAQLYSNGDVDDIRVQTEDQNIAESLTQSLESETSWKILRDMLKKPTDRKRALLMLSVAVFSMWSGNNIVSFYLGNMLDQANVTNTTTQLQINIILNSFCLVVSLLGTAFVDRIGLGAFTKLYGTTDNTSGLYATIAMIFLFQGSYSFGWTPLTVLYPPEVLSFRMRALGMGIYTFAAEAAGLVTVYAFPIAMDRIGWKAYMINGVWDVFQFIFVLFFWVETKGMTLEEIDAVLDGVPALSGIEAGTVEEIGLKKEIKQKEEVI